MKGARTWIVLAGLVVGPCLGSSAALTLDTRFFDAGDPSLVISTADLTAPTVTYLCTTCSQGDFAALTPPPGFTKNPVLRLEASRAVLRRLPGAAGFEGFTDAAGNEFQNDARLAAPPLQGGATFVCGLPVEPGFCGIVAHLESDRTFTYDVGTTLHELTDGADRYVLYAGLDTSDLDAMVLPPGWSHSSRVLAERSVLDTDGFPDIYNDLQGNLWQRVDASLSSLDLFRARLAAALPARVDATTTVRRRVAKRLARLARRASRSIERAAGAGDPRSLRHSAKARRALERLHRVASKADARGRLGVSLPALGEAIEGLLGLLAS